MDDICAPAFNMYVNDATLKIFHELVFIIYGGGNYDFETFAFQSVDEFQSMIVNHQKGGSEY